MRIEEDFQRFREMSPDELKAELITCFEMIPTDGAKDSNINRASSELRFKLLGRVCRILERSSISLGGREYFEDKRFYDLWVNGLDVNKPSGSRFHRVLGLIRDPDFDLTNPADTKALERFGYIDLSMQLTEVRKKPADGFLANRERIEEMERIEGLLERWPFSFNDSYREEIV